MVPALVPLKPPSRLELPPATLPLANVIGVVPSEVMVPPLIPTKPPAVPEVPTVTLPEADELTMVPVRLAKLFSMVPSLLPTSPPDVPDLLPVMLPVAQENDAPIAHTELSTGDVVLVMVPLLRPTRPPVKAKSLALLVTLPNACES